MSVLCVHVCRFCVPNIMSLGICLKKLNLVKVGAFAWCSIKIHVFSVSSLKEEKLIKKRTYMKTETRKLYSRVFWTFLPNNVKINPYNFELYRFKVKTFFETQCILVMGSDGNVGCSRRFSTSFSHEKINITLRFISYLMIWRTTLSVVGELLECVCYFLFGIFNHKLYDLHRVC